MSISKWAAAGASSLLIAMPASALAQAPQFQLQPFVNPLQWIFAPKAAELAKLLDEKKLVEADQHYGRELAYFRESAATTGSVVQRLADELNKEYEPKLEQALSRLQSSARDDYPALKRTLTEIREQVDEYVRFNVFSGPERRSPKHDSVRSTLDGVSSNLEKEALAAFQNFDHRGEKAFFDAYPAPLNVAAFATASEPQLVQWINGLSLEDVRGVHKKLQPLLAANQAISKAAQDRYVNAFLASQSQPTGLPQLLALFADAKATGIKLESISGTRIAFVEATSQTLLREGQIEFPVSIDLDMPLEAVKAGVDNIPDLATRELADFVIAVDVAQARVGRKITAKRDFGSTFVSGTRSEHNPAYDLARSRVVEAQSGLISARIQANQSVGLAAAIVNGVAVGAWQSRLTEAQTALSSTPPQLNKDVFSDYKYSVSEVEASRNLTLNYYVIDRRQSSYYKGTVDIAEMKPFKISYNLNDKDPEKASVLRQHNTEDDLSKYEQTPMRITASALIQDYLNNAARLKQLVSIGALRDEMLKDKNAALTDYKKRQFDAKPVNDDRFGSVVVVMNPQGSQGAGFYVTPDLILTNFHVVEGAKFVEMRLFNGLETFGKVVKSDVRLDLALVKVEARGTPVSLYQEQSIDLGATVEAIGHPRGLTFTLTRGVVSAVRKRPSIYGVGGKEVLFVQTDAAINPGNSGGPLYLGQKVVGVNNNKMVRGAEGLGFAVHYSEVQDFIAEALK